VEIGTLVIRHARKIKNTAVMLYTLLKGILLSLTVKSVESKTIDFYEIRGATLSDFRSFIKAYTAFGGGRLSLFNKVLYLFCSRKLVVVAVAENAGVNNIIGIDMFYSNSRDFKEGTIHEGFVGVSPSVRGRGVATELRKCAIAHFSKYGFSGISSRISLNNLGSLASAKKLGFLPVEQYFDLETQEDRYYMVRPLEART